MEKPEEYKQCPECAEDIKVKAFICRYCGSTVKNDENQEGKLVRVKIKTREKLYSGYIYINEAKHRISDIVNDNRKFISLVNAAEETKLDSKKIGYIALNKSIVDCVSTINDNSEKQEEQIVFGRILYS